MLLLLRKGNFIGGLSWLLSGKKNPPANAGDLGSIPALGRSPGEGNGNPLQYSSWEIPRTEEPGGLQSMGLEKSQTGLSD